MLGKTIPFVIQEIKDERETINWLNDLAKKEYFLFLH